MADLGPLITTLDPVAFSGPYELVPLGNTNYLGQAYNATTGFGDHTTLAGTAYGSGFASVGTVPPNVIHPMRGIRMTNHVKTEIYYAFRLPAAAQMTLTNGLTFELLLCTDSVAGNLDPVAAHVAYFDVCGAALNSSLQGAITTKTPDDSTLTTVTTTVLATGSLPTTASTFYLHPIPCLTATLGIALSCWSLIRIRRLADHQLDTYNGSLILAGMSVYAY